jgi:hypothetical protein
VSCEQIAAYRTREFPSTLRGRNYDFVDALVLVVDDCGASTDFGEESLRCLP